VCCLLCHGITNVTSKDDDADPWRGLRNGILLEKTNSSNLTLAISNAAVPVAATVPEAPHNVAAATIAGQPSTVFESDKKVAFLFMARNHMPLEDIWREFFNWKANSSHYVIHVHAHRGFKYPSTSFFHGKELPEVEDVKWGNMGQVRGIKRLVKAALADPLVERFTMMSESCIPLHSFTKMRRALLSFDKSIINACDMGCGEMECDTRWRPGLDTVGLKRSQWRKSGTWFALNRKHAQIFADEEKLDPGWEAVPCCDEHYLPTLLAYYGLDNETSCTDGFAHVHWPSLIASHPWTYSGDEITPELFQHLSHPNADHAGFGMQCSGVPDMCHFTARKFSGAAKYQLLENIDLILSDDEHMYTGNPWDHHQDKIRRDAATGKYFLIENGFLREFPDNDTIHHMHLNASLAKELNDIDKAAYPLGGAFPSRRDGQLVKAPKKNHIYFIKDGRRHGIPNLDTFYSMGLSLGNVKVLPDSDIEQIVLGEPIPNGAKSFRRRRR